jgi:hypothetical protein
MPAVRGVMDTQMGPHPGLVAIGSWVMKAQRDPRRAGLLRR